MRTALLSFLVLFVVFGGLTGLLLLVRTLRAYLNERALKTLPEKLTLHPFKGAFKDPRMIKTLVQPLVLRGFEDVGNYTASELPGIRMRVLLNEQDQALAVVFEHSKAGHWVNLISYYQDGTTVLFTTNASAISSARPGFVRFRGLGVNPGALYTQFKTDRPGKPLLSLPAEHAVSRFVAAYSEEAAWRKSQGIPTDELAQIHRSKGANRRRSV